MGASEDLIRRGRERVSSHVFEHLEWLKDEFRTTAYSDFEPDETWISEFVQREAALSIFGGDGEDAR